MLHDPDDIRIDQLPDDRRDMNRLNGTKRRRHALLIVLFCISTACSLGQPELFYREARQQQLQRNLIQAGKFDLVYYSRAQQSQGDTLHVYLGGDGIPWHHFFVISDDPGPYSPLVLQLMKQDPMPSIFLGRPCYQGLANQAPCNNRHWTSARYSADVVNSMAHALTQILHKYRYKNLVLIGFSGGGALAVLLARSVAQTRAVLTIAGILDTDAWTDYHSYIPLTGSINPAGLARLPDNIRQIHVFAGQDNNVPSHLANNFLHKQHEPVVIHYQDLDHACCWTDKWQEILQFLGDKPAE